MRNAFLVCLFLFGFTAAAVSDQQHINRGQNPNDHTGDTPYIFLGKQEANNTELYGKIAAISGVTNPPVTRALLQIGTPVRPQWFSTGGFDGSTDDSAAWSSALATRLPIDFSGATSVVKDVSIPANVVITGNGTVKLKTLVSLDVSPIFRLTGTNVSVTGLTFDGNRAVQPADGFSDSFNTGGNSRGRAARAAIMGDGAAQNVDGLTVRNCTFINTWGAPVALRNANNVAVEQNVFRECNFEPLFVDRTPLDGSLNDGISFNLNHCFNIGSHDAGGVNANGCASLINCRNVTVQGNTLNNYERDFIKLNGIHGATVIGNTATNSLAWSVGFTTVQIDAQTAGMYIEDVTVANNLFNGVPKAVSLDKQFSRVKIIGNTWTNFWATSGSLGDGIYVGATNGFDLNISGNTLWGVNRFGIVLVGGTNYTVADNTLIGNSPSSGTFTSGLYCWAQSSILKDVKLSGNYIALFNQDAANNGVLSFARNGTDERISGLKVIANRIRAGGSGNRGIRSSGQDWIIGTFTDNDVDGQVELLHTNIVVSGGPITGQVSLKSPCTYLPGDAISQITGDPSTLPIVNGKLLLRTDGSSGSSGYIMNNVTCEPIGNVTASSAGGDLAIPVYDGGSGKLIRNSQVFLSPFTKSISGLVDLDQSGSHYVTLSNNFSGSYLRFRVEPSLSGYFLKTEKSVYTNQIPIVIATDDSATIAMAPNGVTSALVDADSGTSNATRFWLWDEDSGLLKRVMVGTNNSAGTGFKALKIAN